MPVTTPVPLTDASTLAVLHMPPVVASESAVVAPPAQTLVVPVISAGNVVTVTTAVATQPDPMEYVMTAVPAARPLTSPDAEPIVATPGEAEVHMPPLTGSVSVVTLPAHRLSVPAIAPGEDTIVTVFVT